mgnify:CR=1 FL=1
MSLFIEDADFDPPFTKSKTEQQKIKINNFLYSSLGVFNFYSFSRASRTLSIKVLFSKLAGSVVA